MCSGTRLIFATETSQLIIKYFIYWSLGKFKCGSVSSSEL